MWGHMETWGLGGMGFGMLLFWGLVIVVLIILLGNLWGPRGSATPSREKSALDILNERYARGEIEQEEYEQKKRDIQNQEPLR
ncbi:MAG TPA: SHOCT domain-containing protein [Gallionellaceae bacterium]|nr:SHOCT domain-containing protein [Gallionellaceae bacterium]